MIKLSLKRFNKEQKITEWYFLWWLFDTKQSGKFPSPITNEFYHMERIKKYVSILLWDRIKYLRFLNSWNKFEPCSGGIFIRISFSKTLSKVRFIPSCYFCFWIPTICISFLYVRAPIIKDINIFYKPFFDKTKHFWNKQICLRSLSIKNVAMPMN